MVTKSDATETIMGAKQRRRRFQFAVGVVVAILVGAVVAITIALFWRAKYQRQWLAAERLAELGVKVYPVPRQCGLMSRVVVGADAYSAVRWVRIANLRVTPEILDRVGEMFTTQGIAIDDCVVDDDDFVRIAGLTGIERLYVTNTNLSDLGMRHFARFENLTDLEIENTDVTADGLVFLAGMKNLQLLVIRRCRRMTEAGLVHVIPLVGLRRLEFCDVKISDKSTDVLKKIRRRANLSLYLN
jgi:hypothetical protein